MKLKWNNAGFTLIETICVVAIIAIVIAITTPAMVQAKKRARIASSIQTSHQLWLALSMYRSDYDGDGRFGTMTEMGMPPMGETFRTMPAWIMEPYGPKAYRDWVSPCRPGSEQDGPFVLPTWWNDPTTNAEMALYQDSFIVLNDPACSDWPDRLLDGHFPHRSIGTQLSGRALVRVRMMSPVMCQASSFFGDPLQ
jgi:prepilin-type N-terminal cleavage/methylation domain-containing protein